MTKIKNPYPKLRETENAENNHLKRQFVFRISHSRKTRFFSAWQVSRLTTFWYARRIPAYVLPVFHSGRRRTFLRLRVQWSNL